MMKHNTRLFTLLEAPLSDAFQCFFMTATFRVITWSEPVIKHKAQTNPFFVDLCTCWIAFPWLVSQQFLEDNEKQEALYTRLLMQYETRFFDSKRLLGLLSSFSRHAQVSIFSAEVSPQVSDNAVCGSILTFAEYSNTYEAITYSNSDNAAQALLNQARKSILTAAPFQRPHTRGFI